MRATSFESIIMSDDTNVNSLGKLHVAIQREKWSGSDSKETAQSASTVEEAAANNAWKRRATTEPLQHSSKKRRRSDVPERQDDRPRVGCPFYRKDPNAHSATTSCHGKGFCEMGKLKDHLKDRHHISQETLQRLNFKKGEFTSLRTMEAKWKLVFCVLFPDVGEHSIPSPYEAPVDASLDSKRLLDMFKSQVFREYGHTIKHSIPGLAKKWDSIADQTIQDCNALMSSRSSLSGMPSTGYLPTPQTTPVVKLEDWTPEQFSNAPFQDQPGFNDYTLFPYLVGDTAAPLLDDDSTYLTKSSDEPQTAFFPPLSSTASYAVFSNASTSHGEQIDYSPASAFRDLDRQAEHFRTHIRQNEYDPVYSQSSTTSDEFDKLYDLPSYPEDVERPEYDTAMMFHDMTVSEDDIVVKSEPETQSCAYDASEILPLDEVSCLLHEYES